MSFSIGTVLDETIERLTTPAAGILIIALTVVGILRTAAGQEILRGILERIQEEFLRDPERRAQYTQETVEAMDEADAAIDQLIADLPLAFGIGLVPAVVLWLLFSIVALAVIVITLDAFGHSRDTLSELEFSGVVWKTLNYFVGIIVAGIIVTIGFAFFFIPGVILLTVLFFFPAAIVMDDENAFGALSASVGVAKKNFLGSFLLVVLTIAVMFGMGFFSGYVGGFMPAIVAVVVEETISAIALVFSLALMARAYVGGTRGPAGPDGRPAGQGPPGQPPQRGQPQQPPQGGQPQQPPQGGQPQQPPQGGQPQQPPNQQGRQQQPPNQQGPPDERGGQPQQGPPDEQERDSPDDSSDEEQ